MVTHQKTEKGKQNGHNEDGRANNKEHEQGYIKYQNRKIHIGIWNVKSIKGK